jgi:hypothetical protein
VIGVWDRLTPAARQVMDLALHESERLGHGYVGDEHVLLGLLGEQASQASSLLRAHGLDLPAGRAELQRLSAAGLMPRSRTDDVGALRAVGIDLDNVRRRLVTAFGAEAVGAAVRRASRRPWWRGGGRRRTPLCGPPLFAKSALQFAAAYADSRGAAGVTPEHLLYGVLRDLDDPYGARLGRRGRRHLTQLGWTIGRVNPAAALLGAHGIDPVRLRVQLDRFHT